MGYRDDFYKAENLIGYTGEIHKMPSVYFRNGDRFGHITQYHSVPQNVGREPVRAHPNYTISNEKGRCVEKIGEKSFHHSRNLFIEAGGLSQDQKDVLLQAIWKCPEKKELSAIRGADRKKLIEQVGLKENMLEELLSLAKTG